MKIRNLFIVVALLAALCMFIPASWFDGHHSGSTVSITKLASTVSITKASATTCAPISRPRFNLQGMCVKDTTAISAPNMTDPVGGGLPPCGPAMAWRHVAGWTYWYLDSTPHTLYFGWSNRSGYCVNSYATYYTWEYVFTA
jgi:hypothetical protein